jgi:hypothetical protein
VFVASNLYNSEAIIPSLMHQVLLLADALGPSNVEVSIYESNSRDQTKRLLEEARTQMSDRG